MGGPGAGSGIPGAELSGDVGPPGVAAMQTVRDTFLADEPLVADAGFDSVVNPRELTVVFEDGVGDADTARLECTWYRSGAYRFHHVDADGVQWRFDRHPNPHSPTAHFHEPPDAPAHDAVESCIAVREPELVARAVLKLWRRAYERGDHEELNAASKPP